MFRVAVSEKQLSVIVKEKSKPACDAMSWIELSTILNKIGPCVKNAHAWSVVNI